MSHIPSRELNTWPLYYELDVRFSQIDAHAWLNLMAFGLSTILWCVTVPRTRVSAVWRSMKSSAATTTVSKR